MANTGNAIYTRLLKVSNDANEFPLDADGIKTSVSLKPQPVKINATGEEGYIPPSLNTDMCPIPTQNENVNLSLYSRDMTSSFYIHLATDIAMKENTTFNLAVDGGGSVTASIPANKKSSGNITTSSLIGSFEGISSTAPPEPFTVNNKKAVFFHSIIPNPTDTAPATQFTLEVHMYYPYFFQLTTPTKLTDPITVTGVINYQGGGTQNFTIVLEGDTFASDEQPLSETGTIDTTNIGSITPSTGFTFDNKRTALSVDIQYITG